MIFEENDLQLFSFLPDLLRPFRVTNFQRSCRRHDYLSRPIILNESVNTNHKSLKTYPLSNFIFQINSMASLFVLESLGKDISSELYSIDKEFEILKKFTESIKRMEREEKETVDWSKVFNVSEDSKFLQTFRNKTYLSKHML